MTTLKVSYNNIATDVLITSADGLGIAAWCSSALVDNQTNLYVDALVGGSLQVGNITADGQLEFYATGSWDGVEFTAGMAGGDVGITWGTTSNTGVDGYLDLPLLGVVAVDTTDDGDDRKFGPYSIASAFGGIMPLEWAVIVKNNTDIALHATGTNNHLEYTGIYFTSA